MSHPALTNLPVGWFHHGEHILRLIEEHRPRVIVELGTHFGQSAIAMARVIQPWGGIIYCVDSWYGVPREGRPTKPVKLHACATNLVLARVSASIRLIVAHTTDAAKAWNGPWIDCLYVDAEHTYEGCKSDLDLWLPHVRPGGLVLGDDYDHPKYPGVNQAWDELERDYPLPLTRLETEGTNPPGMRLVYGLKP